MLRGVSTLAAAFGLVLIALPLNAEEDAAAPSNTASCELHVWPGNDLRSTYHGWFHGGIVDGAVQGREGYRVLPSNPLTTSAQLGRLQQLPLADVMGLTGYAVIIHDSALDSRTLRATPGRLAPNPPSCYAELAVDDVFFQEDIVEGRFLKVLFRFRKFDGPAPTRQFGTYIQEKLLIFPPAQPDADPEPGMDELAHAFGQAVSGFGKALNLPPKTSGRRK